MSFIVKKFDFLYQIIWHLFPVFIYSIFDKIKLTNLGNCRFGQISIGSRHQVARKIFDHGRSHFQRIVVFAFFLFRSSFSSGDFINGFENFSSYSFHFEMNTTIFEFGFLGFFAITALNVPFCLKNVLSFTQNL